MKRFKILGTFAAIPTPLSNGQMSSIKKKSVSQLEIRKDHLVGDDVADKKHHGGEERVIHHYSQKNYDFLRKQFPEISPIFVPGSYGENIFTEELTESELNMGDIYRLGSAKVQLTVSRRPCSTINLGYGDDRILKAIIQSGHFGWFYKVLEEGIVKPGDYLEYLESPFPQLPLMKLFEQGYGPNRFNDVNFLKRCLDSGLMDKGWKGKIQAALQPQ